MSEKLPGRPCQELYSPEKTTVAYIPLSQYWVNGIYAIRIAVVAQNAYSDARN